MFTNDIIINHKTKVYQIIRPIAIKKNMINNINLLIFFTACNHTTLYVFHAHTCLIKYYLRISYYVQNMIIYYLCIEICTC